VARGLAQQDDQKAQQDEQQDDQQQAQSQEVAWPSEGTQGYGYRAGESGSADAVPTFRGNNLGPLGKGLTSSLLGAIGG
jgi:hypothetical protein